MPTGTPRFFVSWVGTKHGTKSAGYALGCLDLVPDIDLDRDTLGSYLRGFQDPRRTQRPRDCSRPVDSHTANLCTLLCSRLADTARARGSNTKVDT